MGYNRFAISRFISRNVLRVCCFTIHDTIYAALHVHCSVLLQMRHSGFDASELTQGFGIGPYVVYSPPMVVIAWYDSNPGCCSCSTFDVSELVSLTPVPDLGLWRPLGNNVIEKSSTS